MPFLNDELLSNLKSKLSDLEMKQTKIKQRQDTIDDLALDTLHKMKVLLAKMKTANGVREENLADEQQRGGNLILQFS